MALWLLPIQTDADKGRSGFWLGILLVGICWTPSDVFYSPPLTRRVQDQSSTVWLQTTAPAT